jgi:hypothetical protein
MTDYMKTIFKLAEAEDVWSDEPEDDASEQTFDREKRVVALLTAAASKMGLDLAEVSYPVQYSEDDREATINVFEEVTLEQLQAVSALGTNVRVGASPSYRDVTRIVFTVGEGMENASLSESRKRKK